MNIKDIKALPPEPPKTKDSQKVALFLGIILAVMAVCQLITLPKFIEIIYSFNLFPTYSDASAFSATLVIFEILAVPFLLRLKLSPGFRATSMIMGWLAILAWLFLSFWMYFESSGIANQSGLFGGVIPILIGPWVITFTGILAVSVTWASWGLWPLNSPKLLKSRARSKKNKTA